MLVAINSILSSTPPLRLKKYGVVFLVAVQWNKAALSEAQQRL